MTPASAAPTDSAPPTDRPTGRAADSTARSSAAETLELAARLRLSTTRLARRLRRQAEVDLTPTVLSAVAAIDFHGPLTLGELAEHEGVAPPTVTKVVNKLEERGLVSRLVDPGDRRVCRVESTAEGRELLHESRQRKNAWLAARLEEFGPEDRAASGRRARRARATRQRGPT